ncbi:MAG: ATP-binding protein [Lachnospiraceae bacterium]|nr:ATP-binding protein [Lachnospiraceae bacterium]
MLLNFKLKNFKSFKNEITFTMLSSMQKTHNDYVIQKNISGNKIRVLPMSVIYGANASGKSNIILAMNILRIMIKEGTLDCKELEPFKSTLSFIRDSSWFQPVELEITFSTVNNIYQYGIEFTNIDDYSIQKEYLYINNDEIFERTKTDKIQIPISSLVKKGYIDKNEDAFANILLKKLNQALDDKSLVLTGAVRNLVHADYFIEIQTWFENFHVIMNANDMDFRQKDLKSIFQTDKEQKKEVGRSYFESEAVKEIMGFAEFGNQKIGFVAETENDELSMCSIYTVPFEDKELADSRYSVQMIVDSELMESKGTIHLIRLIQPFIDALRTGGVIVLDEMDASLHFEIVVSLIRIFNNKELNQKGAQLIFNTHNPIYLDGELLRHDQIVMVEKRKDDLTSDMYSLSDYKLRPEERILKNYLDGKYGALPHMDLEIAFKHILEREEKQN